MDIKVIFPAICVKVRGAGDFSKSGGSSPHDQVEKPLCKLWGKVWPCQPILLGTALLLQSLQNIVLAATTKDFFELSRRR
jgi:hypothetical protein